MAVDTTGQTHKLPRIKTRKTKSRTTTYITSYRNYKINGYYFCAVFFIIVFGKVKALWLIG